MLQLNTSSHRESATLLDGEQLLTVALLQEIFKLLACGSLTKPTVI